MKKIILISLLFIFSGTSFAETVTIVASRDATLIEDPAGNLANGSGPALFAGRTGQQKNSIRRALVYFDLDGVIPRRAIIKRVFLTLHLTPSNAAPAEIAISRVLNEWGEGASFSTGGSGAAAEAGDTTWLHTFYTDQFWAVEGGYYADTPSATALVEDTDFYTWQSTRRMVRDVRIWLRHPDRNHGWILSGDETTARTAKRFDSRESAEATFRPQLTIEYRLPRHNKFRKKLHKHLEKLRNYGHSFWGW